MKRIPVNKFNWDNFTVCDLETTGLIPGFDDIIQVAGIKVLNGKIQEDKFCSFVRPRDLIPLEIRKMTGITDEMVKEAPPPERVLLDFREFCGDSILTAHNGWRFDFLFFREVTMRRHVVRHKVLCMDTIHLSKAVWGRGDISHSLKNLAARLKIPFIHKNLHKSLYDAELLAGCLIKLIKIFKKRPDLKTVPAFWGYLPKKIRTVL